MTGISPSLLADRYRVEKLIASGGMAKVYLAEDTRLERPVAIKVIHSHLASDSGFREKFIREAKIAARLSHPNLVNVFDQGEAGNSLYLVMEYVPGITLRDALNDFGKFTPKRALEIFEPFLHGLAAAHQAGILHRDIKPENVLLADDGRVKLSDFGLSRTIDAHTQTGSLIGTVAYLSPELATRGTADARSDVYSAGIMLFEMLTGKQPFASEQAVQVVYQHANEAVPRPSSLVPEIPAAYDRLVLWATAKDADARPSSAVELAKAVVALRSGNRFTSPTLDSIPTEAATEKISEREIVSRDKTQVLTETDFEEIGPSNSSNQTEHIDLFSDRRAIEMLRGWQQRRKWMIPSFTIAAVLVAAGAGWWFGSGPGGIMTVPEVENRTVAAAQMALESLDAKISQTSENSPEIKAGLVIRTEPASGAWFWRGSGLKLVVSAGPKMVQVPKIGGKNLVEATASLTDAGFKIGATTESFNAAPAGTIFDFTGSDGVKIAFGSKVSISISLGPLPSLVGVGQDVATSTLKALGLRVSKTTLVYSDTVAKGSVVGLVQPQGMLGKGGSVELQVSKGTNAVIMPNLIGETISASIAALQNLGIYVIIDTNQLRKNWGIVQVKSTSVAAGSTIRIGDTVTIRSR